MQHKKLTRSRNHRIIAGVCGGAAEYFETDPLILRLIFIVLALMGGSGVLLYLILAIAIPEEKLEEGSTENQQTATSSKESQDKGVIGLFLIGLGAYLLLRNYFPALGLEKIWPALLIFFGLLIINRKN
jgi:phage shock protein C